MVGGRDTPLALGDSVIACLETAGFVGVRENTGLGVVGMGGFKERGDNGGEYSKRDILEN